MIEALAAVFIVLIGIIALVLGVTVVAGIISDLFGKGKDD